MDKRKFERYRGIPNGLTESSKAFYDRHNGGKHSRLEDQVRETNSPKERPRAWTRVKAMLNWSLGLVLAIICLTDTVDVTAISLQEGCQEILQTKSVE